MSSSSAAPPDPARDTELVPRAARGDRGAMDELLRMHERRIAAICLRMLGNPTDAADATQEAMVAICRGVARFDQRSSFATWVYRVTTNACLDELRRRARRPTVGLEVDGPGPAPAVERGVDDAVSARVTLEDALERLPVEHRAALVLRDLCALDYAEIGDVLQIPPGTVRSRIARARAALARDLGNRNDPHERPTSRT